MSSSACPFQRVTIVGTGLIGGSVAMAARRAWPDIKLHAFDHATSVREQAQDLLLDGSTLVFQAVYTNLADALSAPVSEDHSGDHLGEHLILLASHLNASRDLLRQLAPLIAPTSNTVVSDIGSCKRQICVLGQDLLPNHFIGGHPLAGRERSGLAMAQATLFDGKPWLFCPPAGVQTDARLKAFVSGLGAARLIELPPERHDLIMAFISHFPQLYSTLLINMLDQAGHADPAHAIDLLQFQGTGIAGHLRLAASPYAMWQEVFTENADNLVSVLKAWGGLTEQAQGILEKIDAHEPDLAAWFSRANTLYDAFLNLQAQQLREPQISG